MFIPLIVNYFFYFSMFISIMVYLNFLDLSIFEVCGNVFEVYLSFFQSINQSLRFVYLSLGFVHFFEIYLSIFERELRVCE